MTLGPLDLSILIVYLAGTVALGIYVGRRQTTLADYALGGRNLPVWALMISIVATETSIVTFLLIPALSFAEGGNFAFAQLCLGYIVGRYAIVFLLLPMFFKGKILTSYQVLHERFGGRTRQVACLLFLVTRTLADGLRLFTTALVVKATFGLSMEVSIVVMGATTIVYTFMGGMKAVIWTDCLQFIIYILGALLAGWMILRALPGGWGELVEFGGATGRFDFFNFSFDPTLKYTFWAGLFGGFFVTLASHGTDQLMVQRYLCAPNLKAAGRALGLTGWVVAAQFGLFLLLGVGLAAYYKLNPPIKPFARAEDVFPVFINQVMPIGIKGVVLAALFSAAMSTLSSSLASSATAAVSDLYLPLARGEVSESRSVNLSRGLIVIFGLLQMCVAWGGSLMAQSIIDSVMAIASFTTGVILGLFLLALFVRRSSQRAALLALLLGLGGMSWIALGTKLAWPWYAVVGSLGTLTIGAVATQFWPRTPVEIRS